MKHTLSTLLLLLALTVAITGFSGCGSVSVEITDPDSRWDQSESSAAGAETEPPESGAESENPAGSQSSSGHLGQEEPEPDLLSDYAEEERELIRKMRLEALAGDASRESREELARQLAVMEGWLALSPRQLAETAAAQAGGTVLRSGDGSKTVCRLYDEDAYYSPSYYIWSDLATGENRLLETIYSEQWLKIPEDETLLLYDRTRMAAYDLATGEGREGYGPRFDFGKTDEDGQTERVILGMAYDDLLQNYVVACTPWAQRDEDRRACRVYLSVFDRQGNPVNELDTGLDIVYHVKNFYIYADRITFPNMGWVYLRFVSNEIREANLCYLAAGELPEETELTRLWETLAGRWWGDGPDSAGFFLRDGRPFLSFGFQNYEAVEVRQQSDTVWRITAKDGETETEFWLDTGVPRDNKISLKTGNGDYKTYTYGG